MGDNKSNNGRLRGMWQGYTLDTDPERARAMFEAKHGYAPAEVHVGKAIVLAGPIAGNGRQPVTPVHQLSFEEVAQC